jgi:two-component system alkaline phosphatase synthesis response regulator PhoP
MRKKILVVDDEDQILKLLTMRLQINNYEVVSAKDGYQCIQMAKEEKPDLILLDIKMPNGGGINVFETLRNNIDTEIIPVIFITSYPSLEVKNQVTEMGASGFIAKPFDIEDLLMKIQSLIGM